MSQSVKSGFNFGIGLILASIFIVIVIIGGCCAALFGLGLLGTVVGQVPTPPVATVARFSEQQEQLATPNVIDFDAIIRDPEPQGWTDIQFDEYKNSIKGAKVENWIGTVVEAKQGILEEYYLEIDMPGTEDRVDVYLYTTKEVALAMQKGQEVTFSGTIRGLYPHFIGNYAVEIENVRIR